VGHGRLAQNLLAQAAAIQVPIVEPSIDQLLLNNERDTVAAKRVRLLIDAKAELRLPAVQISD
jgi:hypothetical protein